MRDLLKLADAAFDLFRLAERGGAQQHHVGFRIAVALVTQSQQLGDFRQREA